MIKKHVTYRKKGIRAISALLLLALACSLASCADAPTPESGDTVSFTDALGREVALGARPERVAALIGSFADVWTLAGGTLCAAAEDAWQDFGLELEGAVNIGGAHSPSLELLVGAEPDLVLASASTASNVDMLDSLESMGITVAYFDVDNFEDYLNMLKICTDITGRADLYEQNGLALQEQIESIKREYAQSNVPDEQRRVLLLRASSSTLKAKGSEGTVLGEMLADMGCVNIADSDTGLLEKLSVEAVMQKQPYRIFAVTMGSDPQKATALLENMIEESDAWSSLDAVREGRVHVMDKQLFNLKPNGRWAQAYEVLYETLIEK